MIVVSLKHDYEDLQIFFKTNSRLSRCRTATGSSAEFSRVSPTKVEACKYFLFTESSLLKENKEQVNS